MALVDYSPPPLFPVQLNDRSLSKEARDQTQQSRATKTPHNPVQYEKTCSLPQWKKPGWDQLLKIHHEVWRINQKSKKFS